MAKSEAVAEPPYKSWMIAHWTIIAAIVGALYTFHLDVQNRNEARLKAIDNRRDNEIVVNETKAKEAAARLLEAKKPFLERRLKLYFEATEVTGKLASLPMTSREWQVKLQRFWELYYAEMTLVEHIDVAKAMINLGYNIRLLTARSAPPGLPANQQLERVRDCIVEVATAIRTAIQSDWGNTTSNTDQSGESEEEEIGGENCPAPPEQASTQPDADSAAADQALRPPKLRR